ncbi:PilX N-terminal domain-containing pilus assembly protein [Pseudomonas sp.]|uniref:pilus assembly PilX family protein n=1 Tax=Pseudomonas sp. TaxID=306 RepID=UPI00272FDFFA|nr:PilX N-terminal domain-containing pilus assembly protein [Pseudomonas sp.]MDP2244419.1 PilX N-terminal domain-containing pilus assembly protein [Pseudomonas sp.]
MDMTLATHSRQTGATLIVALVFLVVLTIAGITAMQFSTLEERMASNSQFRNETFQQAQNEIRSELLAFNASLLGRAPLLDAINAGSFSNGADGYPQKLTATELKQLGLPNTTRRAVDTTTPIPAPGFTVVRYTKTSLCTGANVERFECTDYELQTRSQMDNGAYSEQSQGIIFMNTKG